MGEGRQLVSRPRRGSRGHGSSGRRSGPVDHGRPSRAAKLRDNRNIGDFRRWKEHDAYQKTLDRLLRDLRVEKV